MAEFPNREYVKPNKTLADWKAEAAENEQKLRTQPKGQKADQLAVEEFQRNLSEGNIR